MLLGGLGPQGRFDTGHTIVADLASELSAIKEHLARYMDYDMAVIDPATASAIKTCLP